MKKFYLILFFILNIFSYSRSSLYPSTDNDDFNYVDCFYEPIYKIRVFNDTNDDNLDNYSYPNEKYSVNEEYSSNEILSSSISLNLDDSVKYNDNLGILKNFSLSKIKEEINAKNIIVLSSISLITYYLCKELKVNPVKKVFLGFSKFKNFFKNRLRLKSKNY